MMPEIERVNLDAHVSICELRYQQLTHRVAGVEQALSDVKTLIEALDQRLQVVNLDQRGTWERAYQAVIVTLTGVVAWLVARVF